MVKRERSFCHMYILNGVELRFHRGIEPHTKTVCALLKYTQLKDVYAKKFCTHVLIHFILRESSLLFFGIHHYCKADNTKSLCVCQYLNKNELFG